MKTNETLLRTLQKLLSGKGKKIFPNQIFFYHAVFGITNPDIATPEEIAFMVETSEDERLLLRSGDSKIQRTLFLLNASLDSNSANIGKHINNVPDFAIPRIHRQHYQKEDNRLDIVHRLYAAIRFCLVYRSHQYKLNEKDMQELSVQMKASLQHASSTLQETDELNEMILANIIYEVVLSHFQQFQEHFHSIETRKNVRKVDISQQQKEYINYVDCYGTRNIDRFFALKRYADINIFAANELACVYYYGADFFSRNEGIGNDGRYLVDADATLAARYFMLAAQTDPPYAPACWSLGYMILNMKFPDITEEEAPDLAETYFQIAANAQYEPAFNSLGQVLQIKADKLLHRLPDLTPNQRKEMLSLYTAALRYFDRAGGNGWAYGHNSVAAFFASKSYQEHVLPYILADLNLSGPTDVRERYLLAAQMDNLWAIDQAALLDIEQKRYEEAHALWEKAALFHYSDASLHLARFFYSANGIRPNKEKYRQRLAQASDEGCARASYELARYLMDHVQPLLAREYLKKAEEQNYCKFNNELHHQIQKLKKELLG